MNPKVHLGQIVLFTITENYAKAINDQRSKAGYATKTGNQARAGDVYPLIVTRLWPGYDHVNGQLLLDGNDTYWLTSVKPSTGLVLGEYSNGQENHTTERLADPGVLPEPGYWHWA